MPFYIIKRRRLYVSITSVELQSLYKTPFTRQIPVEFANGADSAKQLISISLSLIGRRWLRMRQKYTFEKNALRITFRGYISTIVA